MGVVNSRAAVSIVTQKARSGCPRPARRPSSRGIRNMQPPITAVFTSWERVMASTKKVPAYRLFSVPDSQRSSPSGRPQSQSSWV